MEDRRTLEIMEQVAGGRLAPEEAARMLRAQPSEELGYATLDHGRETRKGFPEVVFGTGKTVHQIGEIAIRLFDRSGVVLVTRADDAARAEVLRLLPGAQENSHARLVWADRRPARPLIDGVAVVTGGTSDLPVADEAAVTAGLMGCKVDRITDVGVAGLHRLLAHVERLRKARVLVVAAGMEGALPSVIAGLVRSPVIAVPTSVGYGASFGGLAALLAMVNSCAPGVAVVNIDNGFGAGYLAAVIAGATGGRG
ncbi:MAG: nickel pincer cofactor biosynthesis protein LarB [Dehalococcoidia bacterium]|nr:nickel pincer cofactor biosynthesis protein LarB [Dehalococcoidia bacterium]MSQ35506.1 nickel pincer cofactor biosynthesis protein LarB [Dehalococcoidia bacterium]